MKRFDYFSDYSFFDTDNEVPNNGYRNHTYAGRFGVALGGGTDLSGTIRHIDTDYGSPNAFGLFQIADDSTQKNRLTFGSVTASSQWTNRVQSTRAVRHVGSDLELSEPDADRHLRRSLRLRRQLSRQRGHASPAPTATA